MEEINYPVGGHLSSEVFKSVLSNMFFLEEFTQNHEIIARIFYGEQIINSIRFKTSYDPYNTCRIYGDYYIDGVHLKTITVAE